LVDAKGKKKVGFNQNMTKIEGGKGGQKTGGGKKEGPQKAQQKYPFKLVRLPIQKGERGKDFGDKIHGQEDGKGEK